MRRALLVSLFGLWAVTGCASSHSSAQSGSVPWVNKPLPLYHMPAPQLIRYPTTAPPCRAGRLRVSRGQIGAATGNLSEPLIFTNLASRPCLLRGYPTVSAVTPSGTRRTLHPQHGTFFGPYVPADLPPGGHVFVDFGTSSGCEGGKKPVVHYRHLVFRLPQGGLVRAGRVSVFEQCGLGMSQFGLLPRYGPLPARPGTPGTLQATVGMAGSVRAGTKSLDYVITLSNPTAKAVRLAPCPGYSEAVYTRGLSVHRSFALDCDTVHVIPAHGHVHYAMHLPLPRPVPAGPAPLKFGWNLDTANGPFVGRALLITKT